MQKVGAFEEANPNLLLLSKRYNVKFKPTGGTVKLKVDKDDIDIIFEVVRRNEEWQTMLAEKLQLYSDFYENFAKNDAGFYAPPKLIFVGEDVNHNAEIFRIIKKVGLALPDDEILFTTDLEQLESSLEKTISMFEFDKENNKYKLAQKDWEILKPGSDEDKASKIVKKTFSPNVIVE